MAGAWEGAIVNGNEERGGRRVLLECKYRPAQIVLIV